MAEDTAAGASPATTETVTPAAPAQPQAPVAPAEDPKELTDVLSKLAPNHEQLMRLASGESAHDVFGIKAEPAAPVVAETKPAEEAAPEAEDDEAETPEVEAETDPEPEPAKPESKSEPSRFRFKTEEDRAVALLAKTLNVSLVEAAKRYESLKAGTPAAAAPTKPATEPEEPEYQPPAAPPEVAEIDQQVATIDTRIKELIAQRAKATEEFDHAKIVELSDQLSDAKLEKATLGSRREMLQRQAQSTHENAWVAQAQKSRDVAYAEFPELAKAKSRDRLAFDAYVANAQRDPARASIFNSPRWPEKLAREFATEYGLTAATATPATPETKKPATPAAKPPATKPKATLQQVPGAKLLNGADGTNPSASRPQLTESEALANLGKLSASERLRLAAQL